MSLPNTIQFSVYLDKFAIIRQELIIINKFRCHQPGKARPMTTSSPELVKTEKRRSIRPRRNNRHEPAARRGRGSKTRAHGPEDATPVASHAAMIWAQR